MKSMASAGYVESLQTVNYDLRRAMLRDII